jgi:Aspartyl protease/Domain of unknown function (DUF4124)
VGRAASVALACALAVASAAAAAELWQWTDAEGVVRYTNDPETIPPALRGRARDVGSPQPRSPSASVPTEATIEPRPPADTTVMPTEAGAPIRAAVRVNGVPLVLIVDTGADRTVLSPAAVARAGIDATRAREVGVIVGVTGNAVAHEVSVERLDVAGRQLGPLGLIVHEIPVSDVDGLLGRDVLDHFTLTVEPGARRAVLTPR